MDDRDLAEATAAARRPKSCPECGGLYIGSAFTIHRDGGRCLPDGAYGQLELVDGAWIVRGSGASGR